MFLLCGLSLLTTIAMKMSSVNKRSAYDASFKLKVVQYVETCKKVFTGEKVNSPVAYL